MVQVARLIAGWLKTALVAGGSGGDSVGNSGCDSVDDNNNKNRRRGDRKKSDFEQSLEPGNHKVMTRSQSFRSLGDVARWLARHIRKNLT